MFSDTHQVEIALPDHEGTRRMSGPTYLGWKVPVDGGLFNIYAIGWEGPHESPSALCVYFHPEGVDGYERIIIGLDKKFKDSEMTFRGKELSEAKYFTGAEELKKHLPRLKDADLPDIVHITLSTIY